MNTESFDDLFKWRQPGATIRYGTDVLAGLTEGARAFAEECRSPKGGRRPRTPVLLGSTMWVDDEELLEVLADFYGVCLAVRKQKRSTEHLATIADIAGLPIRAFSYLRWRRPAVDGAPEVIGPSDGPLDDLEIGPFRAFGIRSRRSEHVPILHAKLALLGHTWWYEDDFGSENQAFTPDRLWVSSANFTSASRRSLEFGFWTEDPELLKAALTFLEIVLAYSEQINPSSDKWEPELLEPEFDHDAFAEAAYEAHVAAEEAREFEELDDGDLERKR